MDAWMSWRLGFCVASEACAPAAGRGGAGVTSDGGCIVGGGGGDGGAINRERIDAGWGIDRERIGLGFSMGKRRASELARRGVRDLPQVPLLLCCRLVGRSRGAGRRQRAARARRCIAVHVAERSPRHQFSFVS